VSKAAPYWTGDPADMSSFAAIYVNHLTNHLNIRTYLMAGITCL
jgi:hypothetical protein